MDILKDNLGKVYRKYLLTAFGSALILSIYSTVDMIATGQYEGPNGSAALSVITPMWSVIFCAGILFAIGGAILMSNARGAGDKRRGDEYFSLSVFAAFAVTVILTAAFALFRKDFLQLCGADADILPYAMKYTKWLTVAVPLFLMGQVLLFFVRNDGAPGLATASIMAGGIFNIFGDIFFVFTCDMGIEGAGLATAAGQLLGMLVLCSHFLRKGCKLRLVRITAFWSKLRDIVVTGFASFVSEASYAVIVILFNNQIMRLSGSAALSVYGIISNVAVLIQSMFYAVGQAVQPILSVCTGAGNTARSHAALKYALSTACVMGIGFFAVIALLPEGILRLYMDVTPDVLAIGPAIVRTYSFTFLFMGLNVVTSYYFQAVLQSPKSLLICILRGFTLCSVFVFVLPALFGFSAIWWSMPLTELLTFIVSAVLLRRDSTINRQ